MKVKSDKFNLVIQYQDLENHKNIEYGDIYKYLTIDNGIKFYSLIKHDHDFNEDGEPKTIHYHLYIETFNTYDKKTILSSFAKWLLCNINILSIQVCESSKKSIRYLIHADQCSKYQYNFSDIITSNPFYLEELFNYGSNEEISIQNLIELILGAECIAEVYSYVGLKNSARYRNVIMDLWKEIKKGL